MAEVISALISACVTVGKLIYDEMKRMHDQAEHELERAREEIRRATTCGDERHRRSESDSDEEEPVPVVDEKKPSLALMVLGAALVAHVIRRATK